MLKALFFGTSDFAVPSLRVVAKRTQLAGVVTQPDRPAGRGQKLKPTPVKSAALELGVPVFEPTALREFALQIAGERYDLFALASYGRILPQALLDLPRLGALNVHPSLLSRYRGATPIQAALLDGDEETGVSIMLMDSGMDTGDLVLQERLTIDPNDTYGTLHDRLAAVGAALLERAIRLAEEGPLPRAPQSGDPIVTTPIRKEDLVIDWSWDSQRIVNHVRAYSPQPAARAIVDGETIKILRAHVTPEGRLAIDELVAPNRGKMSYEAFVQSHPSTSLGTTT
jgi:methionyl-tRNA formyltransferase